MFLRHTTAKENVSCEQRLRRLASLAGDGIPSLTRANRAEARCWGHSRPGIHSGAVEVHRFVFSLIRFFTDSLIADSLISIFEGGLP